MRRNANENERMDWDWVLVHLILFFCIFLFYSLYLSKSSQNMWIMMMWTLQSSPLTLWDGSSNGLILSFPGLHKEALLFCLRPLVMSILRSVAFLHLCQCGVPNSSFENLGGCGGTENATQGI